MVQMARFGPFPAPQVVRDGPDWTPSILFLLGINVALVKFVLKSISEAGGGPDCQVSAISGPHVVRQGWNSHQMVKIKFSYHLEKIKVALKCIPEAALEVLLLLGVALKANVGYHPNHVFCHLLTTPDHQKVVSFMEKITWFSATIYGCTVPGI